MHKYNAYRSYFDNSSHYSAGNDTFLFFTDSPMTFSNGKQIGINLMLHALSMQSLKFRPFVDPGKLYGEI